jgi:hypothetical protein
MRVLRFEFCVPRQFSVSRDLACLGDCKTGAGLKTQNGPEPMQALANGIFLNQ